MRMTMVRLDDVLVRELWAECLGKAEPNALLSLRKVKFKQTDLEAVLKFPQAVNFEIKTTE